MDKPRIMTLFGTRPEAIKMAPVVRELATVEGLESLVTVSAQHREMLDQVLSLFNIVPDFDLDIMEESQSLSGITTRVLQGLEDIFVETSPDLILVHGDTSTTFVGALASFYQQLRVGHVEAGLRTYDKYSPFPEEMNRHLTGVLADLHFAPTAGARDNLLAENIAEKRIMVTGNTVIDALQTVVTDDFEFEEPVLKELDFQNQRVILLTAHRRENLGPPMERIFRAARQLVEENSDIEVVFPVHLNPKIRRLVQPLLGGLERVHLIEPLTYAPFVNLMARSELVMTDSGGIQEEAPGLGKPVLLLRETTERPEALEAGTVKKVGSDRELIVDVTNKLLHDRQFYRQMARANNPYGDGQAARRIVHRILYLFGLVRDRGREFSGRGNQNV
ncbi:MAG: non-hydrolyzing UDP-N-acetylglucosamine 2-epimerase [Bacillota bacterium]